MSPRSAQTVIWLVIELNKVTKRQVFLKSGCEVGVRTTRLIDQGGGTEARSEIDAQVVRDDLERRLRGVCRILRERDSQGRTRALIVVFAESIKQRGLTLSEQKLLAEREMDAVCRRGATWDCWKGLG